MARPKYPSDERRLKQRPHVKVHLSARSHPRYGAVFEDPEMRGMAWGLWLLAVQYHAGATDERVTLGLGDLVWLTGRSQWAPALNALRTLCERLEYPMTVEGRRVVVEIRNLKRKQGFISGEGGDTPPTTPPSEEPKNQGTKEPRNREENSAPPGAALSKAEEAPEGEEPRRGDVDRLLRLLSRQPGSEAEKRAWLEAELPVMEAEVAAGKTWAQVVRRFWAAELRRQSDGPRLVESFDERSSRLLRERAAKLRAEGYE